MAIDFFDPENTVFTGGRPIPENHAVDFADDLELESVTDSSQVSGIELRMLPPLIKDNHTPKIFPFPGYAKLYCLTIVVSDATNQLVGTIDLKGFPRIGDNETLPINKTLFYWQAADAQAISPNQIHVMCTVIKSKQGLRDAGEIMTSLKGDSEYTGLLSQLGKFAKDVTSFNAVTDTITQIAGVVGKYLGHVEDKALGTVVNSYTTLYGDFDKQGVNPYEYKTKNVDFMFQLVVRNQVQPAAASDLESVEDTPPPEEQEAVEVDMQPL